MCQTMNIIFSYILVVRINDHEMNISRLCTSVADVIYILVPVLHITRVDLICGI